MPPKNRKLTEKPNDLPQLFGRSEEGLKNGLLAPPHKGIGQGCERIVQAARLTRPSRKGRVLGMIPCSSSVRRSVQMLERLRNLVLEALPEEGRIENPMPCLALTRFNGPQQSRQCFYHPMMTLGLGGEKESLIGGRPVVYGAGEAVVVALDLPGAYQIRNASPEQPFLSLSIRLDRAIITELLTEAPELRPAPNGRDAQESVSVEHLPDEILNALVRYLEAMHSPRRAAVLGPMILKEIHYLLLEGPQGRVLADVCSEAAPGSRILTAVRWLREHFDEPLDIATFSERTAMAPSTFHRQFRAVTSLSPVQYQKRLRLHEAQRLMLVESLGVEAAARRVGYESCSQFSREYKRLFGDAPARDIREKSVAASDAGKCASIMEA